MYLNRWSNRWPRTTPTAYHRSPQGLVHRSTNSPSGGSFAPQPSHCALPYPPLIARRGPTARRLRQPGPPGGGCRGRQGPDHGGHRSGTGQGCTGRAAEVATQSVQLINEVRANSAGLKLDGLIFDRVLDQGREGRRGDASAARRSRRRQRRHPVRRERRVRTTMLQQSWVAPGQIEADLREQVQLARSWPRRSAPTCRARRADRPSAGASPRRRRRCASTSTRATASGTTRRSSSPTYKAPWITQVTPVQGQAAGGGCL